MGHWPLTSPEGQESWGIIHHLLSVTSCGVLVEGHNCLAVGTGRGGCGPQQKVLTQLEVRTMHYNGWSKEIRVEHRQYLLTGKKSDMCRLIDASPIEVETH